MLDKFGRDGMSSDESDTDENGRKVLYALIKPWRSVTANMWVHKFDEPVQESRLHSEKRGRPPRCRIRSNRISSSKAVNNLPGNAYDSTWLQAQNAYQRRLLNVKGDSSLFAHL